MSQIYKPLTSAGPIPPNIPTQFTTDVGGPVVPVANNVNVFGLQNFISNDNGIRTEGIGATLFVELTNRISRNDTTTDLQTVNDTLFTPTDDTAYMFKAYIVGYDTVGGFAAGGSIEGLFRKNAGVVTVVGSSDTLDENDAALEPPIAATSVDWNIVANGANLDVQFVGVLGATINWKCLFTYIQVS